MKGVIESTTSGPVEIPPKAPRPDDPIIFGGGDIVPADPDTVDRRLMPAGWEPVYRSAPDGQPPTDNMVAEERAKRRWFRR